MFNINIFAILLYTQFSFCINKKDDTSNIQDILKNDERNARCVPHPNNFKNSSETTNFEVRALFVKCIKLDPCDDTSAAYTQNIRKVAIKNEDQCDDADNEKSTPQEITSCDKKLKLTVKIKNVGATNTKSQYIIIDHVFDPLTEKKQKLLNPYVLKIKQEPLLAIYGLSFESMVNSEAKEKVINKNSQG